MPIPQCLSLPCLSYRPPSFGNRAVGSDATQFRLIEKIFSIHATICAARSRCHLRNRLRRHDPRYGNGGSAYGTAIPLAESICGTTGGLYPSRVSGPRDRVEREIVVTNSAQLFCLLSAVPNEFSLGQRRPGAQGSGAAGTGARGRDSTGRGITPPISTTRCLAGASQLHRCLPC